MLPNEIRNTLMIGAIFAFRMLGAFMVFPVLALYLNNYPDASMAMVGVALGAYGLFQALLQLPLAALSDKYGRKRIILAGLMLFALGSLIAAFSATLSGIIIGRAIQGMGAIGATLLAYLSDTTRPIVRTRAMAIVGACIGAAFTLSVAVGPVLDAYFGLKGLFLITALLALLGIIWVSFFGYAKDEMDIYPQQMVFREGNNPENSSEKGITGISFAPRALLEAIFYPQLWRLYLSVFILHAVLTMSFLVIPFKVQSLMGLSKVQSWQFYVPILFVSLGCVMPLLRRADEAHRQKNWILFAVIGLFATLPICLWTGNSLGFAFLCLLFFVFFNYLEASLPAWVSKLAPQKRRGLILGVYSSAQFLGIFVGGSLGGLCWAHWQQFGIIALCTSLLILWLVIITSMSHSVLPDTVRQELV